MRYYFFIALYMGIIALGSLSPMRVPHHVIAYQDKYMHFFMYLPLGFLLSFPKMPSSYGLTYLLPLFIGAVYGISMEWLQSMLPYRMATWGDAVANTLGVFLGLVIGWGWIWRKNRSS